MLRERSLSSRCSTTYSDYIYMRCGSFVKRKSLAFQPRDKPFPVVTINESNGKPGQKGKEINVYLIYHPINCPIALSTTGSTTSRTTLSRLPPSGNIGLAGICNRPRLDFVPN